MDAQFQALLRDIPDYDSFLTLDEMDANSRLLAAEHPESTTLMEIGRTREDRPLLCLKIGSGPQNALMFGCPHPNEPIGAMMLEYLTKKLAKDEDLRERLGYTWYFVKAWDADGYVKNEGWLKGPFNIYNYGRNFFRPAGFSQVDWTFPIDYKKLHFHNMLPETAAMKKLIDEIQPRFIYALHNSGFGGVYWYESEPTPEIYDELHKIPGRQQLPLSLGSAESPSCKANAPAIYQDLGIQEMYDYIEKYVGEDAAVREINTGDCSAAYAHEHYGTFTLLTELPYFFDPSIEDQRLTDMTRLDIVRQKTSEIRAINEDLRSILALSKDYLSKDNPYVEAVADFSHDGSDAELNCAENDPAFLEKITYAEKLDELVIGKFYKMILYGMLIRANETELTNIDASLEPEKYAAVRKGFDAALAGFEKIMAFLESNLNYQVVPIKKLIRVQLESGLRVIDYLKKQDQVK